MEIKVDSMVEFDYKTREGKTFSARGSVEKIFKTHTGGTFGKRTLVAKLKVYTQEYIIYKQRGTTCISVNKLRII